MADGHSNTVKYSEMNDVYCDFFKKIYRTEDIP